MEVKLKDYNVVINVIKKPNKNIYFRIKDDLILSITCPLYMSKDSILKLIKENEDTLTVMYEKALKKYAKNKYFYYLGKPYQVIYDDIYTEPLFNEFSILIKNEDYLNKFYLEKCNEIFNEEIEKCKKCFYELPQFSLTIRKMKTRWGVCNVKTKRVTLNSELLKYDPYLIDYVIIHEFCHFFEQSHNKRFWTLVGAAYPKYKEARKALKD